MTPRGIAMRSFGRVLQIVGLTVPPLSVIMQLSDTINLKQMLTMLVASVCLFLIGRLLEGYAR
jgi:hypothetical protein